MEYSEKEHIEGLIRDRIIRVRMDKNMSARKCSELMGVSSQYINQIESGGKMPSFEGLKKFCDVMGITLGQFFDYKTKYPAEQTELMKYCNLLSQNDLKDVINIVKRIAYYRIQNKK